MKCKVCSRTVYWHLKPPDEHISATRIAFGFHIYLKAKEVLVILVKFNNKTSLVSFRK